MTVITIISVSATITISFTILLLLQIIIIIIIIINDTIFIIFILSLIDAERLFWRIAVSFVNLF